MANRPQNSAKGSFSKSKVSIGASGYLFFEDYSTNTAILTTNTTSLLVAGSIRLNGQANSVITGTASGNLLTAGIGLSGQAKYFTANSTATAIIPTVAALPSARVVGGVAFVSNSTGKALAYHSTGTTWLYVSGTSVLA